MTALARLLSSLSGVNFDVETLKVLIIFFQSWTADFARL